MKLDTGALLQAMLITFAIVGVFSIAFIIWERITEEQQEKELDKMRERQHLIIDIADQVELRVRNLMNDKEE